MSEHIGGLIKRKRLERKVSQTQLARKLDIYPSRMSRIEKGILPVRDRDIDKISKELKFDIWKAFMEEPYKETKDSRKPKVKRRSSNAKFTNQEVRQIREMRAKGKSTKKLSEIWGVSVRTIRYIVNGSTYSDV